MTVRYEAPFLYKNQPYEAADLLNRLQQDSKLPLLIAADFELGVSNRLNGTTGFPNAMAIGATSPHSLYDGKLASQSNIELFDSQWAQGFTSLWTLAARMAGRRQPQMEERGRMNDE